MARKSRAWACAVDPLSECQGKLYIFMGGKGGNQVEKLENEPHFSRRYLVMRVSLKPVSSSPSTTSRPPLGRSSPPTRLSVVVLPEPDVLTGR